jgi:hypothetical protein
MKCADCKHWSPFPRTKESRREGYFGLGGCEKITKQHDSFAPRLETTCGVERRARDVVADDAELITPPDFGCSLFEAKPCGS